jgi:hypothetical protein
MPVGLALIVVMSLYPVDAGRVNVILIEVCAEVPVQVSCYAARHGDSHAQHIDGYKNFVPGEVPENDEQVVAKHDDMEFGIRRQFFGLGNRVVATG